MIGAAYVTSLAGPWRAVRAAQRCAAVDAAGLKECEAGVDSSVGRVTALEPEGPYRSQWCWAACIEMVFGYHGYRVPQARIVEEAWGTIGGMPRQPPEIARDLGREWVDDEGGHFTATASVGRVDLSSAIQHLAADVPLIVGLSDRTVLLTLVSYIQASSGEPELRSLVVRDPMPGRGRQVLTSYVWSETESALRILIS